MKSGKSSNSLVNKLLYLAVPLVMLTAGCSLTSHISPKGFRMYPVDKEYLMNPNYKNSKTLSREDVEKKYQDSIKNKEYQDSIWADNASQDMLAYIAKMKTDKDPEYQKLALLWDSLFQYHIKYKDSLLGAYKDSILNSKQRCAVNYQLFEESNINAAYRALETSAEYKKHIFEMNKSFAKLTYKKH